MGPIKSAKRDISDIELAVQIGNLAEENFAEEVKVIDVRKLSCVADYLILLNGNSSTHMISLCNKLDKEIRPIRERLGMEGRVEQTEWVLLDYGTILINIFSSSARIYYNLDEFWNGPILSQEDLKKDNKQNEIKKIFC